MKYYIYREDCGQKWDEVISFDINSKNLEYIAVKYADYYWSEYDGWDCYWPITFTIADDTGKILGKVEVTMEAVPTFTACLEEEK